MRAGLAAIPYVGGSILEMLNGVLQTTYQKDAQKLLSDVAEQLAITETRLEGFDPQDLGEYPPFLSAVARAILINSATYEAGKCIALRNALVNVAVDRAMEDHRQERFLRWIDELSELHIVALHFFSKPQPWRTRNDPAIPPHSVGSTVEMLLLSLPQFRDQRDISQLIVKELGNRELLKGEDTSLFADIDSNGNLKPIITELGQAFLNFITDPLERMPSLSE